MEQGEPFCGLRRFRSRWRSFQSTVTGSGDLYENIIVTWDEMQGGSPVLM